MGDGARPVDAGSSADGAPRVAPDAQTGIPFLAAAIRAAAPRADAAKWVPVLEPHLSASDITSPRRVAAFLGQVAVEAAADLSNLTENTRYTSASHLREVFPSRFPTLAVAQSYVGDRVRIACRAYAGKNGNGDEASGDGWRFRGAGLIQLTGRDNFMAFATILSAPVDQVADWVRTPNGAAASACWYWRTNKLNALADDWDLARITRAVNGKAMLAHALRVAAAEAALRAAGTA